MTELEFSQALETPMKEFHYNFSFSPNIPESSFAPNKIVGNASVQMVYFVDFDSILHLKGNLRVLCEFVCDRCASNFERNLFLEFDEKIYPSSEDDNEDLLYDMPHIMLDKIFSDFIILNFPSRVLCKEDCKGICPTCGANLNDGECECSANKIGKNNPFAELFKSKLGGKK